MNYVVIKLISGETVMASYESEDDKFVKVEKPVQIKTVIVPGINREQVTAAPYCQFSDSTTFVLEKSHIIYIKKLHKEFIKHYNNFILAYDEALIPATPTDKRLKQQLREMEEMFDDEEDTLTVEEINRRLDILEAIANAPSGDAQDEVDELLSSNFVEGNDTKH